MEFLYPVFYFSFELILLKFIFKNNVCAVKFNTSILLRHRNFIKEDLNKQNHRQQHRLINDETNNELKIKKPELNKFVQDNEENKNNKINNIKEIDENNENMNFKFKKEENKIKSLQRKRILLNSTIELRKKCNLAKEKVSDNKKMNKNQISNETKCMEFLALLKVSFNLIINNIPQFTKSAMNDYIRIISHNYTIKYLYWQTFQLV